MADNAPELPADLLTRIIEQYLLDAPLKECLDLRRVNKWFDDAVIRQLFIVQIKDLKDTVRNLRVPRHLAFAQLQGFFAKRNVPLKNDRRARRAMFQTVGHSLDNPAGIAGSCFAYDSGRQKCGNNVTGSSSVGAGGLPECKIHDLLNALISALGSAVFYMGSGTNDDSFHSPMSRNPLYYRLLLACYRNREPEFLEILQEMEAEGHLPQDSNIKMFCNCFLIAAREDYPGMVNVLLEESKDREEVTNDLDTEPPWNALIEAIRLGHCEVVETFLKWKWKFTNRSWTYSRYIKLILYSKLYVDASQEQEVRERLLRSMFEWTETWRDIAEMKGFLMKVGIYKLHWALKIAVETLKSSHYFRYERGQEGSFRSCEPLASLAKSGNTEIIKLYIENRKILLPHTTDGQDMVMRQQVVAAEFDRKTDMRVDIVKCIIEHSQDLVEKQTELQNILVHQFDQPLKNWTWLAEKVGLKSFRKGLGESTLGGAMLGKAASKLCVNTVSYLVTNGVKLENDASTFQVYEDNPVTMNTLRTVRELLSQGGQGEVRERRVIETTFLPTTTKQQADDTPAATRAQTGTSSAKQHTYYPRFLRKNLITGKHNLRKQRIPPSTSSQASTRSP